MSIEAINHTKEALRLTNKARGATKPGVNRALESAASDLEKAIWIMNKELKGKPNE